MNDKANKKNVSELFCEYLIDLVKDKQIHGGAVLLNNVEVRLRPKCDVNPILVLDGNSERVVHMYIRKMYFYINV